MGWQVLLSRYSKAEEKDASQKKFEKARSWERERCAAGHQLSARKSTPSLKRPV